MERIRDEKVFDGLEALEAQIASDVVAARSVLAEKGNFGTSSLPNENPRTFNEARG